MVSRTDRRTHAKVELPFLFADMRFMDGERQGFDGLVRRDTFALNGLSSPKAGALAGCATTRFFFGEIADCRFQMLIDCLNSATNLQFAI